MSVQNWTDSERNLQARILEAARALRWLPFHVFDSRRSQPGFPDLVLVRPPRLIFAELKSAKGRITAEQQQWLDLLSQIPGVEIFVWRPADLQDAIGILR